MDDRPRSERRVMAISGASGFLGSALVETASAEGWDVRRMVRCGTAVATPPGDSGPARASSTIDWDPARGHLDAEAFRGVDVVVHLAGEGIGGSRWNEERKARILESRRTGTELVANTIAAMAEPRPTLLSGSAVGFYGDTGSCLVDESSPGGNDFLHEVCRIWEAAAEPAATAGARVVALRTGVVLHPDGGALGRQLPAFRWGLGGFVPPGTQYLPWISRRDYLRAILFLADRSDIAGPVNMVAPMPVTNREFARALGRALHRPTSVIPIAAPRLLLGRELADALLRTSQRVDPRVLTSADFEFLDPDVDGALRAMLT